MVYNFEKASASELIENLVRYADYEAVAAGVNKDVYSEMISAICKELNNRNPKVQIAIINGVVFFNKKQIKR